MTPSAWKFSGFAVRTGRRECSRSGLRGFAAALLAAGVVAVPSNAPLAAKAPAPLTARFLRGVCWVAGGPVTARELDPLVRDHVSWISQTPFGWQADLEEPSVRLSTGGHAFWGERDEGLIETTRLAHARGIRVLLKPHVWTRGGWSGAIAMKRDEDWAAWFRSYETFLLHYADLAERQRIEALAVGTELGGTTGREREWRALIARVRARYHGALVYCANWAEDVDRVRFWDALDWIGVQAYYPLSDRPAPSVDELCAAWRAPLARLHAVADRARRPVVFTEVGYHSLDTAASRPWEWRPAGNPSPETQARCYEALFRVVRANRWIRGVFIWKWFPEPSRSGREGGDSGYTPQAKAAEGVMARQFGAIQQAGE